MILVIGGMVLIIRPPFLFGQNEVYLNNPMALYAAIVVSVISIFIQPNVYIVMRALKGKNLSF